MLKHMLPIETKPPVLYGLHHARPLSIIMAHKESEPWFFSNYIQMCFRPGELESHDAQRIDFGHSNSNVNSLLHRIPINDKMMCFDRNTIVEFTIKWLSEGYYVEMFLNESEVPGTRNYSREVPTHHSFIFFGYDLSDRTFKTVNFNKEGHFSIIDVAFEVLAKVYNSQTTKERNGSQVALLLEYTGNLYIDPEPNTYLIKESLNDYIYSVNTIKKYKFLINYPFRTLLLGYIDGVFGISIYKEIMSYLRQNIESVGSIDFRIFHAIWEHKKVMISRIEYLENMQKIKRDDTIMDTFKDIEQKAKIMRASIIKCRVTKNEDIIDRCVHYLNYLYETEPFYIERLIKSIY